MFINHLHQSIPESCGHVCATMLLESQNIPVLVDELIDLFPLTRSGLSLKELQQLFTNYKSETVLFQCRYLKSAHKITPLIVRINQELNGHYIVVWKYFYGHVLISDPALERPIWIQASELDKKTNKYYGISIKRHLDKKNNREWGWKLIQITLSVWLLLHFMNNTLFGWPSLLAATGLAATYVIQHHHRQVFPSRDEIERRLERLFSSHNQMQVELRLSHLQSLFNKKAQLAKMTFSLNRSFVDMVALLITLVFIQPLNCFPIGIWLLIVPKITLTQIKKKKPVIFYDTAKFEHDLREDLVHLKWLVKTKQKNQRVEILTNRLMRIIQKERQWLRIFYLDQVIKGVTIGSLLLLVAIIHLVIHTPSGIMEWVLLFSFLFASETWNYSMKSFDFST